MTYRRLRVINDETLHTEIENFTKPEIKENEVLVKVN